MTETESPDLDPALVERTRGPQPWRRLFHAVNGGLVALLLVRFEPSTPVALGALGTLLVALLVLDFVRLRVPRVNEWFFRWFQSLASPREADGMASSTWYTLGLMVSIGLFPRAYAISGILVLAVGDPAASWIGRRYGRRPFLGATLEGSAAFAAAAAVVLAFRHPPAMVAVAAVAGALAERVAWPLDDNLAVPVATAGSLTLLALL